MKAIGPYALVETEVKKNGAVDRRGTSRVAPG